MRCNFSSIRKAFSLTVFCLFLLLFLGNENMAGQLSKLIMPWQFVPALVHSIAAPAIFFILGLCFLLGLSFLFGRVYCSFLCPLGILQDFFIYFSRKLKLRPRHSFQKPNKIVRYSILGLTLATAISGSLALVNLLDPYSSFGRIINHIGERLFAEGFNAAAVFLAHFDFYIFPRDINFLPAAVFSATLFAFLLILLMAASAGRLYCNTICPVGTLLGLIARIAVFRFTVAPDHCDNCRKCESVCKAGCINSAEMSLDQSRCVGCFNCLYACPQAAIDYQHSSPNKTENKWSPRRRRFIVASAAAAGAAAMIINPGIRRIAGNLYADTTGMPVTPPGSLGWKHFSETCTACHLCVSACPTKVITPAFLQYGPRGIMQPLLNYEKSYCDYECNICGIICPTGAIGPVPLAEKKLIQIGEAELLKSRCIVYTKNQNCGACLEVCPTHTLYSVNRGNILYPETHSQYCIGCGACEKVCPTAPKSIIVRPNAIHKKAAKYEAQPPTASRPETGREFPF